MTVDRPPVSLPPAAVIARAEVSCGDFSDWTTGALVDYVGGFSNPSKMPGYAYGIPAETCQVGARLNAKAGTVCSGCYALKGAYAWRTTQAAYWRRYDRLDLPYWSEAIATVLRRRAGNKNGDVFRWHDSGDLQSVLHLWRIVQVANLSPDVRHWIPTREYRIVADYRREYGDLSIPGNLSIRMSAHMVGGFAPSFTAPLTVSTVSSGEMSGAHECPARFQGNECKACRACWDQSVAHVNYHLH